MTPTTAAQQILRDTEPYSVGLTKPAHVGFASMTLCYPDTNCDYVQLKL